MGKGENYEKMVKKLARYGCFSIGWVYLLIGVSAMLGLLRITAGGDADEARIVAEIMSWPLGEALLWLMAGGMVGYVIWRFYEALTDPYEFGNDLKGMARRTAIGLSSLGYGVIVVSIVQTLLGDGGDGEEEQQMVVAQVLQWTAGPWLVGAAGLMTAWTGVVQVLFVAQGTYKIRLNFSEISETKTKIIKTLAWAGFLARGAILLVLGYFLIRAALDEDPSQVGDTDTAFDFIGTGVVGHSIFVLVALGTIAYGFFMFACAIYYRFRKGNG